MYIIIAGGGKVGEYLASDMLRDGHTVVVIEQDAETADRLSIVLKNRKLMVVLGDACDSGFQKDAGIAKADVFVAATGHDDTNLVACEIAQRVFNVPRCVARVNSPKNRDIFKRVGVESISSTELISSLIKEEMTSGAVSVVTSLAGGNIVLAEVSIPRMRAHSSGIALADIDMPEGSQIIAVVTEGGAELATDGTFLNPGDSAVVIAEADVMAEARAAIRGM